MRQVKPHTEENTDNSGTGEPFYIILYRIHSLTPHCYGGSYETTSSFSFITNYYMTEIVIFISYMCTNCRDGCWKKCIALNDYFCCSSQFITHMCS